ncbi:MAG TPA: TetR/AcrR family transcriptional regulator [Thermomicrobiales bacterium]|nr:TetR/AcrR family transcriptional regulator [Thermomicrobiales bacterium]
MSSGERDDGGEPDTRTRILAATWRLMEERRGQGVRLSDIARAAGVSRQAVYLHFGSRATLLVATVRYADRTRGLTERLGPFRAAATGVEALDAFVDFWGHYIPDMYGLARALLDARATDEGAAAAWDDRMAAVRGGCRLIVAALARDGTLAPGWTPDEATDTLWALLSVAVWEQLVIDRGRSVDEYVRWLRAALRRAFVRPPWPPNPGGNQASTP